MCCAPPALFLFFVIFCPFAVAGTAKRAVFGRRALEFQCLCGDIYSGDKRGCTVHYHRTHVVFTVVASLFVPWTVVLCVCNVRAEPNLTRSLHVVLQIRIPIPRCRQHITVRTPLFIFYFYVETIVVRSLASGWLGTTVFQ